jgi:cob(I)alamin adenosyltransferase
VDKGLIHVYCGDGKGKTTAALGLAVRAAGRGYQVLIIQFLKSQDTGELHTLEKIPGITVLRSKKGFGFYFQMTDQEKEECRVVCNEIFHEGITMAKSGQIDLLILDEMISTYNHDLVERQDVLDFLKNKPSSLEVVLTGREPAEELIALADYVSEIKKVKHPYDKGIKARIGIER